MSKDIFKNIGFIIEASKFWNRSMSVRDTCVDAIETVDQVTII